MFLHTIIDSFRQTSSNPTPPKRKPSPHTRGNDAIVCALRRCRQPMSISELAEAMGCSVGESSKRVKAAAKFLKVTKDGRRKLVSLRDLDRAAMLKLMATIDPSAWWTSPSTP